MKNWLQYLKLWQKKRGEWPVGDDADAGWTGMQSLLDEHMPVDDDKAGGAFKKRGINLVSVMLISLSAAAMVYVTAKVVKSKFMTAHTVHHYHHKHHGRRTGIDSLADADSLLNDSIAVSRDSINQVKGVSGIDGQKDQLSASDKTVAQKNLGNVGLSKPADGPTGGAAHREPDPAKNAAGLKRDAALNSQRRSDQNNTNGRQRATVNDVTANRADELAKTGNRDKGTPPAANGAADQTQQNYRADNSAGNPATSNTVNPSNAFTPGNENVLLAEPRQSFGITMTNPNQHPVLTYIYPAPKQDVLPMAPGKAPKIKNGGQSSNSNLEWGVLIGVNSAGSFTPKSQNSNFYGSLPVDGFLGLYAACDVSDKWAVGTQVRVLSPSVISGNYQIPHILTDSPKTVTAYRAQADSRKLYSVQIPLYAAYKATDVFSFKAGPLISLPTKQFTTAKTDSASSALLMGSHYDQKPDLGLSGGVSLRYKWLSFDIMYLRGITNHKVASDSLSYNVHNSQLQFTIGIQLGGKKK